jgi:hypothetical protein
VTAKTPNQRKAAERARKKAEGLEEVRGIYAPKSEHDKIRAMARIHAAKCFQVEEVKKSLDAAFQTSLTQRANM